MMHSIMKFALGQSLQRIEDDALLCGAGRYADDFALARVAHACFVRSPHAHARIKSVAIAEAAKAPGVLAVLTGKDAAADRLGNIPCLIPVPGLKEPPRPVLALRTVRHVGDPLVMVIAETAAQAFDHLVHRVAAGAGIAAILHERHLRIGRAENMVAGWVNRIAQEVRSMTCHLVIPFRFAVARRGPARTL